MRISWELNEQELNFYWSFLSSQSPSITHLIWDHQGLLLLHSRVKQPRSKQKQELEGYKKQRILGMSNEKSSSHPLQGQRNISTSTYLKFGHIVEDGCSWSIKSDSQSRKAALFCNLFQWAQACCCGPINVVQFIIAPSIQLSQTFYFAA